MAWRSLLLLGLAVLFTVACSLGILQQEGGDGPSQDPRSWAVPPFAVIPDDCWSCLLLAVVVSVAGVLWLILAMLVGAGVLWLIPALPLSRLCIICFVVYAAHWSCLWVAVAYCCRVWLCAWSVS